MSNMTWITWIRLLFLFRRRLFLFLFSTSYHTKYMPHTCTVKLVLTDHCHGWQPWPHIPGRFRSHNSLQFNLSPNTTCLNRPYYYAQWGILSRQPLLYHAFFFFGNLLGLFEPPLLSSLGLGATAGVDPRKATSFSGLASTTVMTGRGLEWTEHLHVLATASPDM